MLISLLQIALLSYLGLAALIYLLQDKLIFQPSRELMATPTAFGLPFNILKLHTDDGERLDAWHVPAQASTRSHALVLIFHGNAGNISHRLDYLRMFHDLGYASLIIDYRGYGHSTGTPSEAGTRTDAATAWRHATTSLGYPPERIVIFGESLGGAVAAHLASVHRPAALVLASTFTSVPDLGAEIYPWLPVSILARTRFNSLEHAKKIASPVVVIHSRDDDVIPFAHGERLFAAVASQKLFIEIRGGHNEGYVFSRGAWVRELGAFLRACLPPHTAPAAVQ